MMCSVKSPAHPHGAPNPHDSSSLLLSGGWVALDASTSVQEDLEIASGRISRLIDRPRKGPGPEISGPKSSRSEISVEGCLVLPGLVNSHDHLEFNLFPRLGRGPYPNFEAWARDIYHPDRAPVREHLGVPKPVRLWW